MADGRGQGAPREVPSEALDRLFLELHDKLPRDARGKLAQLADEVKTLTESSTAEDRVTPSSSADQAVVRREEEIITAEAKQSSGELQARGAVVTSLSDQPTLKDVVCHAEPRVAPKWYNLGLALDIQPFVLNGVAHQQEKADRPREMFAKWLEGSPGTGSQPRTWQTVLDAVGMICGSAAVEDIRTAVQTPRILTAGDLEESKTTEHSSAIELSRKRCRLSARSSDDPAVQQSVAKKSLHDYLDLKMDLLAQDIADLHSESDPTDIIKLLYSNFLTRIAKLLTPHFAEVKIAADNHCQLGLHKEAVAEGAIASAESVDGLFGVMSVKRMWDNTRFFRKVVAAIPESAPERQAAEGILLHYNTHLDIYKRATLLRDALAKEPKIDEKRTGSNEEDKLIPLKITSAKPISHFTSEDCYHIQARLLGTAYHIPQEKIICQDADESRSTTITFLVSCEYIHDIVQCSMLLPTMWVFLELDIIEVSIPGVFTFIPSVDCFLSLLRGSKAFTADLLQVTEVLPYQTYCLLDPNTKEPLSGRPLSTKRIEQHWDSHGDLVPDLHGPVPESGDIEILDTHSEEAVIPPKGSDVGATDEWQSKVGELEDKVKDLERKVANLFMDNVALKTKLEASREVERQQQEEIAHLKERLVQALSAQDTATQEQSLSRTRESELKEEIKVLEEVRSDLETEVEKLQKHMKQLEILPSDIEQFAKDTAAQEQSLSRTRESELKEEARSDLEAEVEKLEKQMKQLETLPSDSEQFAKSVVPGQVTGGPTAVEELARIREEATKGSSGETSAVPGQVTGGPTAATRGSQPPTQDSGLPPVVEAAMLGQLSTVRKLLDSGSANVEDRDKEGMTALLWASFKGHLPVVRELVNVYKGNVFQKSKEGSNAMHAAAQGGHIEIIKYLLPMFGARVHEKTNASYTVLHWAALGGHCQVARYLITELKLDPQDRDKWGNTVLLRAAQGGSVPLVRMLLEEYGSSVDEVNEKGRNAMHKAAEGGSLDVITFLAPLFGARVHEKTNASYTVLHVAAQEGHCQVARYLITELKLDPQDRDKWGTTALLRAADGGSVPLVRMLLEEYGSSVDEVTEGGHNAMHMAALGGSLDVIKYLLPLFGERVHETTNNSYTMLHWAAQEGHCQVARYLITELMLDPQDRDKWGCTALLRAAYNGHAELVRMLLDSGSTLDEVDNRGWTAVLEAAAGGHLALVRELVEQHRADLLHKSNGGWNVLHLAAANGHLDLVKYLLPRFGQHKFDKTNAGKTCLDLAVKEEKHNVVEYLQQKGGFSDRQ